jgi:PhnB protein
LVLLGFTQGEENMSLKATPHLNFYGDARAALHFYQSVFGGETIIRTYGDFGMPKDAPGANDVVFGQVAGTNGFRVLAYDIPGQSGHRADNAGTTRRENGVTLTNQRFFVAVDGDTFDEVKGYWEKLSSRASIIEPFAASAWSAGFGMVTDHFGVTWILSVAAPPAH